MKCTNDAKLVQCWSSFVRFCAEGNVYDNQQLIHCEHNAGYLLRKDKEQTELLRVLKVGTPRSNPDN